MGSTVSALPQPRLANSSRRRRSPISLTPLIDVVFILLVFFMLASSFLDWRAIDLDAASASTAPATGERPLLVEVGRDELQVAGESLSLAELGARVRARLAGQDGLRVLVRPAPGVSMQRAVAVLDGLAAAGAVELSLVRHAGG